MTMQRDYNRLMRSPIALWASLERLYETANASYHNGTQHGLTDAQFDRLERLLVRNKRIKPRIGAPVTRDKVALPIAMPSLEKDFDAFASRHKAHKSEMVGLDKLDGISILLQYTKGKFAKAFTRGTGTHGQDVTRHMQYLDFPKLILNEFTGFVRAEIIMPSKTFEEKYRINADAKIKSKYDYATARNMVAGTINRKESFVDALKDMHVVGYWISEPHLNVAAQVQLLKFDGFKTPTLYMGAKMDRAVLTAYLAKRHEKSLYAMDGLVLTINDAKICQKLGTNNTGNPRYAVAFKVAASTQTTTCTKVEWKVSKDAYLKPTVWFDPILVDGVTIEKATGHNAKNIIDNKIGKGAVLEIARAGDVIPYIARVVKPARHTAAPSEEFHYDWNETRVDFVLNRRHVSQDFAQLVQFFTAIGAEGLDEGILQTLFDKGFNTPLKVMKLTVKDYMQIDGFQKQKATNTANAIKAALNPIPLPMLLYASSCFGRGFGMAKLTSIAHEQPEFFAKDIKRSAIIGKVANMRGFSVESATQFADGLEKWRSWYRAHKSYVSLASGGKLAKFVVCFTGIRSTTVEKILQSEGGTVANSVTTTTTHLVVPTLDHVSDKVVKAQNTGSRSCRWRRWKRLSTPNFNV